MKKFFILAALAGCTLGAMTLASCGSDDDSTGGGGGSKVARWEASLTVTLNPDYPDTKDVINITGLKPVTPGSAERETVSNIEQKGNSYTLTMSSTKLNVVDSLKISAAINPTYVYTEPTEVKAGYTVSCSYTSYDKNGNKLTNFNEAAPNGWKTTIKTADKWNQFANFISRSQTANKTLLVTVDGNGGLQASYSK